MSSAIQTSGVPTAADLGKSPLHIALLRFVGFGLGGMVLFGVANANHGGAAGILVVILMLPWTLFMLYLGIRLLMLVTTGGGLDYRRTKTAVQEGRLSVSYYLKGYDHIIVMDEPGHKLCVNGDVLSFDQVKALTWESGNNKHRLCFALTSGANPIRNVDLYDADQLKNAFERLSNSLGLK